MVSVLDVLDIVDRVVALYTTVKDNYDSIEFSARQSTVLQTFLNGANLQLEYVKRLLDTYKAQAKDEAISLKALKDQAEHLFDIMTETKETLIKVKAVSAPLWILKGSSYKQELLEKADNLHVAIASCYMSAQTVHEMIRLKLTVDVAVPEVKESKELKTVSEEKHPDFKLSKEVSEVLKFLELREQVRRLQSRVTEIRTEGTKYKESVESLWKLRKSLGTFSGILKKKLAKLNESSEAKEFKESFLTSQEAQAVWERLTKENATSRELDFILRMPLTSGMFSDGRTFDKAENDLKSCQDDARLLSEQLSGFQEIEKALTKKTEACIGNVFVIQNWGKVAGHEIGLERSVKIASWCSKILRARVPKDKVEVLKDADNYITLSNGVLDEVIAETDRTSLEVVADSIRSKASDLVARIEELKQKSIESQEQADDLEAQVRTIISLVR